MAIKCDILVKQGKHAEALKAYQELAEKAENDDNRTIARLGAMRVAQDMGNWNVVKSTAATLLDNGNLNANEDRDRTSVV